MKALYPNFMFVYIDAEFAPDLRTPGGLVSLAVYSKQKSLYRVNADADREAFCASEFREKHIWSKLPLCSDGRLNLGHAAVAHYSSIAVAVSAYFYALTGGQDYRKRIGLIANHGTQDVQRLHDLFDNDWARMPPWIPRRLFADLATLEDLAGVEDGHLPDGTPLPELDPADAHHALKDAEWDHRVHEFLMERDRSVRIASGVERPT